MKKKKGVADKTIKEHWGELRVLNRYHVSKPRTDEQGTECERFPIGFHDGPMGQKRYREELQ